MKTLDQCRREVAERYGYQKWENISFYEIDERLEVTSPPYAKARLTDEVAELYATSQIAAHKAHYVTLNDCYDEIHKKYHEIIKDYQDSTSQIEELTKEVERFSPIICQTCKNQFSKHPVKCPSCGGHRFVTYELHEKEIENQKLKLENDRYREALEGIEADILANEHDWCRNPQAMFNKFKSTIHPLVKEGE